MKAARDIADALGITPEVIEQMERASNMLDASDTAPTMLALEDGRVIDLPTVAALESEALAKRL